MATSESFGRYQLLGMLGRGGMGQVFRAHDTATDRIVALKLLPPHLAEDSDFQERFRREARTAAGLNDPHVVPIHGFGEIDGRLYVDMRLIEGRDLRAYMTANGGRLSPPDAVAVIEQVAAALESAHQAGLVHRDVKPSNILVANARNFVYLIDFGIARATADTSLTQTGHTMGTLAYMAPERFRGTTDPRADVYSLACVLHECLTGRRPYPGDSFEEQLSGHLNTPPPQPSAMAPDIPPAFDAVIARGMAKNPDERYWTTIDLAIAAKAALTNPISLPPEPAAASGGIAAPPPDLPAAQGSNRTILMVAGVTVAVLGLMAALVITAVIFDRNATHTAATAGTTPTTTRANAATTAQPAESSPNVPNVPPLPAFAAPSDLGANCQYPAAPDHAAKVATPPRSGKVSTDPVQIGARIVTNQGDIGVQLDNGKSPCTVNSFVSLAQQGFFDNTQCHRLTASSTMSVLQCGDPKKDGTGGPGYEFANEYPTDQYPPGDPNVRDPVIYPRGTLAMAHSEANSGPNTNGSQFFIVYEDSQLPPKSTVFGTVDDAGMAIVDKIAKAGVVDGAEDGAPITMVTITSVRLD
ncbi:protein kinase domain-containing protein [Mycobacterium sp.]|uniref:protein kinase domain-containing protein n=1 Tax=Mycobacterium sp. TaxID=1785 RepID=UPI003F9A7BDD